MRPVVDGVVRGGGRTQDLLGIGALSGGGRESICRQPRAPARGWVRWAGWASRVVTEDTKGGREADSGDAPRKVQMHALSEAMNCVSAAAWGAWKLGTGRRRTKVSETGSAAPGGEGGCRKGADHRALAILRSILVGKDAGMHARLHAQGWLAHG